MNKRVLLIDDDPAFREMLSTGLTASFPELDIDQARDGYLGEKRLEKESYDLILLDYKLPFGMSGLRFLEKTDEMRTGIPLIMITGEGNEEVAARAFRLGVTDYLVKRPGLVASLTRIIREIFSDEETVENRRNLSLTTANSGVEFIRAFQEEAGGQGGQQLEAGGQKPEENEEPDEKPESEEMEDAIMVEFEEANEFNKFTSFIKRMKGVKLHDVRILEDKFVVILSLLPGRFDSMGKVFSTA